MVLCLDHVHTLVFLASVRVFICSRRHAMLHRFFHNDWPRQECSIASNAILTNDTANRILFPDLLVQLRSDILEKGTAYNRLFKLVRT